MVPSKKNIGGWEEHTGFGGGLRTGAQGGFRIFFNHIGLNFFLRPHWLD